MPVSRGKLVFLFVLPLAFFWASLFFGRYPIPPLTVLDLLASRIVPFQGGWPETLETVIFDVRLPRILLAMSVGAGLSISGASFQGMFQNPLVGPSILGVSSSAGFGAALAILLSQSPAAIQVFALCFGLFGVLLTYGLSRVFKTTPTLVLVLSGIVVGAFFSALISMAKYVADPYEKLPAITFWLMGSLGNASPRNLLLSLPPMVMGMTGLVLVSWRINILSMGDEEARALGIRTEYLKGVIILCATVVTASAVCVAGIIGWVGLVVPHVGRMIVGPDHRVLLPASIAIGSSYLLLVDDLSRTVSVGEIPLGILTALIGAPFFAYLIRKTKGGWN
ncbi:MAG: iron ABC transporter permease [Deltaproteobacteria bacterium]|nr:iron ABC transporter permease [Deltaproteobacteria bacterium]